jgi:arginine decarboxylase
MWKTENIRTLFSNCAKSGVKATFKRGHCLSLFFFFIGKFMERTGRMGRANNMNGNDQNRTPLLDALYHHLVKAKGNFHVPGHKQGQAWSGREKESFQQVLSLDLTELPGLDDLHHPEGPIQEAQELAANLFGAEQTFFLVGGSTAGNLALVMSCCEAGDRIIVQRNSHQSVFNGCKLAGAKPIYISGRLREDRPSQRVEAADLEQVLSRFPDAKAVFLTSPDYYGESQPLAELAEVCHRYGIPLLVDEAHGAHLGLHPELPPSALTQGADAVVQSTHKMLPAMTMASMLHLQGTRIDRDKTAGWLRTLQSSSPSYPLMASLDIARRLAAIEGKEKIGQVLKWLKGLREHIHQLTHLTAVSPEAGSDPLKLLIRAKDRRVAGRRMLRWLAAKGSYLEMADHRHVLAVFSMGTTEKDVKIMAAHLEEMNQAVQEMPEGPMVQPISFPLWSESRGTYKEVVNMPRKEVPLHKAKDGIAAEMVVPYPPGIPIVLPGEVFTEQAIRCIEHVYLQGGQVRGCASGSPLKVYVLQ